MTAAHPKTEMADQLNADCPRVWVGCLGCYNAGCLVGGWFGADVCPTDGEELAASGIQVSPAHVHERHVEVWVLDHEDFGGVLTGECSVMQARHLAELIANAEDRGLPLEVLGYWVSDGHETDDIEALLDKLSDAYCGLFDSGADYAQQLAEDLGAIPADLAWPLSCIDWAHAWRELELGGDNYAVRATDGGWHVFRAI